MPQMAVHLNWAEPTVRETIDREQKRGLGDLWEAEGRARHRRWSPAEAEALEQWVPRRYSAVHLSHKLADKRQLELGPQQVRRILKKNST